MSNSTAIMLVALALLLSVIVLGARVNDVRADVAEVKDELQAMKTEQP